MPVFVDTLKAGDDNDIAFFKFLMDALGFDAFDAGLRMHAVLYHSDLKACKADGLIAHRFRGHR